MYDGRNDTESHERPPTFVGPCNFARCKAGRQYHDDCFTVHRSPSRFNWSVVGGYCEDTLHQLSLNFLRRCHILWNGPRKSERGLRGVLSLSRPWRALQLHRTVHRSVSHKQLREIGGVEFANCGRVGTAFSECYIQPLTGWRNYDCVDRVDLLVDHAFMRACSRINGVVIHEKIEHWHICVQ